jgi:hypothetical protein
MFITLYARKEPTTDHVSKCHGMGNRKDVVLYGDADCKVPKARFPWFATGRPRQGQRGVTLNCFRWSLCWV